MKWRHTQDNLKSGQEKSVGAKLTTSTAATSMTSICGNNSSGSNNSSIPTMMPLEGYVDEHHSYTGSSDDQTDDEIDVVE